MGRIGSGTRTALGRPHRSDAADKAAELANEQLEDADKLPAGLTPHSLRRTFASLLYALGEAPPYVMSQMGHETPALALAIYAREMDRRDARYGLETMCIGGGQGLAALFERVGS